MGVALGVVIVGFLLGSIPTGVLLARSAGIDVRSQGSGNIGATNVARTAGKKLGILTLIGDVAKGLVAVFLAWRLAPEAPIVAATATAAVAGHCFSPFLGFRGGKGVATGLGVLLGLGWPVALAAALVFGVGMALTRTVSIGSLGAALAGPVALVALGYPTSFVAAGGVIAAIIVFAHRENIVRIRSGAEGPFRAR